MSDLVEVNIEGLKNVSDSLKKFKPDMKDKIMKFALDKGANSTMYYAQMGALTKVGGHMGWLIAQNYRKKMSTKRTLRNMDAEIGKTVKLDKNEDFVHVSKTGKRTYIPAAIEYGHVSPSGKHVEAMPFFRSSWNENKDKILHDVLMAATKKMNRIMRKIVKGKK